MRFAVKTLSLVNLFLSSVLCASKFVSQVVNILRNRRSSIADRRSTIAHCRTFAGSLLQSRSLQVSILPSTVPYITFKDTNNPLVAAVVVWKLTFDAPSIGLSRATSIAKSTATSNSSLFACALALGERSRGFALYLYPDMQGIVPKGLQNWSSRSERQTEKSDGKSDDVYRRHPWCGVIFHDVYRRHPRSTG